MHALRREHGSEPARLQAALAPKCHRCAHARHGCRRPPWLSAAAAAHATPDLPAAAACSAAPCTRWDHWWLIGRHPQAISRPNCKRRPVLQSTATGSEGQQCFNLQSTCRGPPHTICCWYSFTLLPPPLLLLLHVLLLTASTGHSQLPRGRLPGGLQQALAALHLCPTPLPPASQAPTAHRRLLPREVPAWSMGWTVQTHPLTAWEQTQLNLSHGSTQQHEQAWQQHKQDVTLIGCPAGKQLPSKSRLASAPSEASVGCGLSLARQEGKRSPPRWQSQHCCSKGVL